MIKWKKQIRKLHSNGADVKFPFIELYDHKGELILQRRCFGLSKEVDDIMEMLFDVEICMERIRQNNTTYSGLALNILFQCKH